MFAQTGRPERAIELYRRAIVIQPNLAAARFNLGLALLGQGNGSDAKRHFEALVQSNPDDSQAHFYLGRILQGEGNDALAEIHLEKASRSPRPDVRAAALKALHDAKEKR